MCFIGLVCLIRIMKHRNNKVISLSNYAEQLIQLCIVSKLWILNVRTKGDFQWHFANFGYQGWSTVDLALASENIFLIQYPYVQTFTTFSHDRFIRKSLWPLFIDEVQLSQGYRATTRSPFHSVPGVPGTHLIDLVRMKDWTDFGASSGFETGTLGLKIQRLNH